MMPPDFGPNTEEPASILSAEARLPLLEMAFRRLIFGIRAMPFVGVPVLGGMRIYGHAAHRIFDAVRRVSVPPMTMVVMIVRVALVLRHDRPPGRLYICL